MTDPRDYELSRIYREGAWPEPRRQLDDAILEASRRAARARRSASFVWRFGPPFAFAATVVLASALVLKVYREQPEAVSPPPRVHPAPRVSQPAARPVGEPKPLAGITASKSEPAPPAFALKKETPDAVRADALQRGSEVRQNTREQPQAQVRTAPAPQARFASPTAQGYVSAPAAPPAQAPGAGVDPGASAGAATTLAAHGVPGRSPQIWLEDIRKLKAQGRNEDAQRELAEFGKRYPDYRLPDDLR